MKKIRTYEKHGKREVFLTKKKDIFDDISDESSTSLQSFAGNAWRVQNRWCQPQKENLSIDLFSPTCKDDSCSPLRPLNKCEFQKPPCLFSTPCTTRSVYHDSPIIIEDSYKNCSSLSIRSPISFLESLPLCQQNEQDEHKQEKAIKEKILELCEQDQIMNMDDFFETKKVIKKIGEGLYGEVFEVASGQENTSVKIVPIEGEIKVNGETQKTFEDMLSEIAISKELSALNTMDAFGNQVSGFIKVHRTVCCKGCYPEELLRAWNIWDAEKKSENDNPEMFDENQIFIIFETKLGGISVEDYPQIRSIQARSILHQITAALAVAEKAFSFEHRDLHWGNILIKKTSKEILPYYIDDTCGVIDTSGLRVSLIDFTLSRLEKDGCVVFCNLEDDETLFQGYGDYQFEIYRMMQQDNGDSWRDFNPRTNVMWIHYLTEKLITCKLQRPSKKIFNFAKRIFNYDSAFALLNDKFFIE